jgi:hypothetical protein
MPATLTTVVCTTERQSLCESHRQRRWLTCWSYDQMEAARTRLLELSHHRTHRLAYKKRTDIAVEIVQQLEQEGHFPQAN